MKFLIHKNGTLLGQIDSELGRDPVIDDCLWGIIPRLSRGILPFIDPARFHDLLDRLTGCHVVIEGHGCISVTRADERLCGTVTKEGDSAAGTSL